MLRDDVLEGMAARSLERAGGPDEDRLQELRVGPEERPELVNRVLHERRALCAAPKGPLDRAFALRLGSVCPKSMYLAPLESGGCVVALLYADNLPGDALPGDTNALEIVLHEAGLALDAPRSNARSPRPEPAAFRVYAQAYRRDAKRNASHRVGRPTLQLRSFFSESVSAGR